MTHFSIIGAGIGGLAAAIGLARLGHEIELFEQSPTIDEVGAGLQLSPNALWALDSIGAKEEVLAYANVSQHIQIYSDDDLLNILDLNMLSQHYDAPFLVIHRADLQTALLNVIQKLPNIALHLNHHLCSMRSDADHVSLEFTNGHIQNSDAVIGADGVNSQTRQLMFNIPKQPTGLVAWRAITPLNPNNSHTIQLFLMSDAHAICYPLQKKSQHNIVIIQKHTAAPQIANTHLKLFTDSVTNWTFWPLSIVPQLSSWTHGRTTLLGDAAHAMPPFAAQGACMAIEDAAILMKAFIHTADVPSALQIYQSNRKKRCENIQKISINNGKVYHYTGLNKIVRNTTLRSSADLLLKHRMHKIWSYKCELYIQKTM